MTNSYDDTSSNIRHELGVEMVCYKKRGGWTEIVAIGEYTDRATIFDHTTFSGRDLDTELRRALRRHARYVKSMRDESK